MLLRVIAVHEAMTSETWLNSVAVHDDAVGAASRVLANRVPARAARMDLGILTLALSENVGDQARE